MLFSYLSSVIDIVPRRLLWSSCGMEIHILPHLLLIIVQWIIFHCVIGSIQLRSCSRWICTIETEARVRRGERRGGRCGKNRQQMGFIIVWLVDAVVRIIIFCRIQVVAYKCQRIFLILLPNIGLCCGNINCCFGSTELNFCSTIVR